MGHLCNRINVSLELTKQCLLSKADYYYDLPLLLYHIAPRYTGMEWIKLMHECRMSGIETTHGII